MILTKLNIYVERMDFSSDLITPVAAYMRLRDQFVGTLLLESSEYNSLQNSKSIIGVNPVYELKEQDGYLHVYKEHALIHKSAFTSKDIVPKCINFFNSVNVANTPSHIPNGFLGYQNFNIFALGEGIEVNHKNNIVSIPNLRYAIYEFVIVFDHFKHTLNILHNKIENTKSENTISRIYHFMMTLPLNENQITFSSEEHSDCSEEEFLEMVDKGKYHCRRGDVFQIVLSRHFSRRYEGDEFCLYRKLRSINPSPYLFYYDYTDYQILGSSPEAQVIIQDRKATLNPIAGTYKRQGNDDADFLNAKKLLQDKKELAEHMMLVDLARNDLSKFCKNVDIKSFKEIQMYSHVIHIVSKVVGDMKESVHPFIALLAISPAGTLSGAPKHKAIQLIYEYEKSDRSFYSGSVGLIDFQGGINQAITIRSCLIKDQHIHYRAGAGIVDASHPESEMQEVYNKISAIRQCFENTLTYE